MTQTERPRRPIRTVIIERSPLVRMGLKHILIGTHYRVCCECSVLRDLPQAVLRNNQPILVLIGTSGSAGQDLSGIESLRRTHKHLFIVVLSDGSGREEFFAAMDADVGGYVDRNDLTSVTLVQALDLVMSRKVVVPLALMRMMKRRLHGAAVTEPILDAIGMTVNGVDTAVQPPGNVRSFSDVALSHREQMILSHLMQGAPNKQIARELAVAEATVKVHVKALLRKIRVRNRTQAAMWAIDHGFTYERSGRERVDTACPGNNEGDPDLFDSQAGYKC